MKLWVFVDCPHCGFTGCVVPVGESPCPRCGFRRAAVTEPANEAAPPPAA